MINLSHFAVYDVAGADAETLMEYLCVAKVGGDTAVGKGIYTHFLDHAGGIRADLTVIRLASDRFRVIDGADAGNRDYVWMKRMAEDRGWNVYIEDRSDHLACFAFGVQPTINVQSHRLVFVQHSGDVMPATDDAFLAGNR